MSFNRLIENIIEKSNPTVAGLDPVLDYIPAYIRERAVKQYGNSLEAAAESVLEFNKGLINALYDIVPAIKPQCAYYELYGWPGVKALYETILYAKSKGMFVIVDGKRNDIGSTMQAYAKAYLGTTDLGLYSVEAFSADALTVNGYLGTDGIDPLLSICEEKDKGIFVLCKTSNPSSGELQDQLINSTPVYKVMATLCDKWNGEDGFKYGYGSVGAVVGATYPKQLKELREQFPSIFFLVPGYGAQGAGPEDIAGAFDNRGLGAIVNSSRGIMCAYKKGNYTEEEYALAARREAIRMRDEIVGVVGSIGA